MRILAAIIILVISNIKLNATGQVGDIIIWNGDTLTLFSNPLEQYERIDSLRPILFGKEETNINTACWRGYIAEWSIINSQLYLTNIYCCDFNIKANLKLLFPQDYVDGKIFASWVNGALFIPLGNCIEYIHMDYESVYEKEIELKIENGLLSDTLTHNNKILRGSDFAYNPEYAYNKLNWSIIPDMRNKHIQLFIGIQPGKNGLIDSIITKNTFALILGDTVAISDTNNIFIREAIRVARTIPEWPVILRRNSILPCEISLVLDEGRRKKYVR
jgi:hypothetical protein